MAREGKKASFREGLLSGAGEATFKAGMKAGREEMRAEALGLFEKYFMDPSIDRQSPEYKLLKDLTSRAAQELKA